MSTKSNDNKIVQLADVEKASEIISGLIKKTELDYSISSSKLIGTKVYLKFENTQLTGSFKIRGASNKIFSLTPEEKKRGVVASSAGNHAQGVALAAARQNVNAKIVMPIKAPLVKVTATQNYGAEVVLFGNFYDEAFEKAKEIEKTEGRVFVHPYDDPYIIAGQGTLGLEILRDLPDVDTVLVPIGGGGLISGIATVIKALKPECKVIGVQAEGAKSIAKSFAEKQISKIPDSVSTIADGIAVKTISPYIFNNYILKLVDDVVTVTEDEIAESIVFLMERAKTVVEGSGAVTLAAAKKLGAGKLGKKCCVILSGGNIDMNIIAKVIERGLKKNGRLTHIKVAVGDIPGVLSQLTKVLADHKANIIQVIHDRTTDGLLLGETSIEFIIETSGWDQTELIKKALSKIGRIE
jgi:threonine dehydratase